MTRKKKETGIKEINIEDAIKLEEETLPNYIRDKKRAQFEATIIRERGFIELIARDEDGEYTNKLTRKQWKAFNL